MNSSPDGTERRLAGHSAIWAAAKRSGQQLRFEACVGGGIPVIRIEDVEVIRGPGGDPVEVRIRASAPAGQHVRPRGDDFREGHRLVAAGELVRPEHVSALATVGVTAPRYAIRLQAGLESFDEYKAGQLTIEDTRPFFASGALNQTDTIDDSFNFTFNAFPDPFNAPYVRTSNEVPNSGADGHFVEAVSQAANDAQHADLARSRELNLQRDSALNALRSRLGGVVGSRLEQNLRRRHAFLDGLAGSVPRRRCRRRERRRRGRGS